MKQKGNNFHYVFKNNHFGDLNPILMGYEHCLPGKSWGPDARNYTLIHYVQSGQGVLYKNGRVFPVRAGEAFLIRPHERMTYTADSDDPWHYWWVGFDGALSDKFHELDDVFKYGENIIEEMIACRDDPLCEYKVTSLLFRMYAELMKPSSIRVNYADRVKDYVKALYMQSITVEEIALQINLDRRYLSRIFKQKTGKTIQEYIIFVRMRAAKEYMRQGMSVEETSLLVGYDDRTNFSKMFKRKFGISPAEWKKQNT